MKTAKVHKISEKDWHRIRSWYSSVDGFCGTKAVAKITLNWSKVTCERCLKVKP